MVLAWCLFEYMGQPPSPTSHNHLDVVWGHVCYHTELSAWTDALATPGRLATAISSNAFLRYVEVSLVH